MSRAGATPSSQSQVPMALLRNDTAYRTMGPSRNTGRIGCGFLVKPGRILDADQMQPNEYSAVYCLRGSGTFRDDAGNEWPLRVGSIFHRFLGTRHTVRFDAGCNWAECWMVVTPSMAATLVELGVLDPRRPVQQPGIDLAVIDDLNRLVAGIRDADERELPRHLVKLLDLLVDLVTREQARDGSDPYRVLIDRACRRLVEDPRLSLESLATELRMSYERFRKVFRELMGVSPGEYRIRRRIDRARALLQTRDLPIKAVAEELGYPNPYAFSAQFKQLVGESPEAFRRRH